MLKLKLRTDNKPLMTFALNTISSFYHCGIKLELINKESLCYETNIYCLPELENIVWQNLSQFIIKENG